jgi:hypothetical protein
LAHPDSGDHEERIIRPRGRTPSVLSCPPTPAHCMSGKLRDGRP